MSRQALLPHLQPRCCALALHSSSVTLHRDRQGQKELEQAIDELEDEKRKDQIEVRLRTSTHPQEAGLGNSAGPPLRTRAP